MYANPNKTKNSQIRIYLLKFSVSQLKHASMVIYTNIRKLNHDMLHLQLVLYGTLI